MKKYLSFLFVGVTCFFAGKFLSPQKKKVEVREVVRYVEKKQEVVKTNKKTVKKETKKPDGTSVTEVIITEDTNSTTKTDTVATSNTSTKTSNRGILVGVVAVTNIDRFRNKPDIGVVTAIPLVGSLSILATADSSRRVGVGLSLEF